MQLKSIAIRNYRRLHDCKIAFEPDNTIFVGANNSGKTSAAHVLNTFLSSKRPTITVYDFSASCWSAFDNFGLSDEYLEFELPAIELDLWFTVDEDNLHRVLHLLPTLDWRDTPVGVRISFTVRDKSELHAAYRLAKHAATQAMDDDDDPSLHPWPKTMTQYLEKRLDEHYRFEYHILDHNHTLQSGPTSGYVVRPLGDAPESGRSILLALIRVDFLHAQRYLSDDAKGRSEDLSKRLSRFYKRNLQQLEDDPEVLRTLADSEIELNRHLGKVFESTIDRLSNLGYPGFSEPRLLIKSAFSPEGVLSHDASVHYVLNETEDEDFGAGSTLPDKYNGLGFKNLIYMVIEILDFHQGWSVKELDRQPIHLVIIEEPEAHLHAQLQQVFIREIRKVLPPADEAFHTQMIITTHSSHIVNEASFDPIRYFRRSGPQGQHHQSEILNLSDVMTTDDLSRTFLQRYMKLTHCDLLFADAAILVEGNVERLLLPLMIDKVAYNLKSNYLTILEVGGAFAQRFKELVEFLGLPTLVLTDLDSVEPLGKRKACHASTPNSVTSNETLRCWIPKLNSISDLLAAPESDKSISVGVARVRVSYQGLIPVTWGAESKGIAGRTFEEAFALENLAWTQSPEQGDLDLMVVDSSHPTPFLDVLAKDIYDRVRSSNFKKTEFALALMMKDHEEWSAPTYIKEGLEWLSSVLVRASEAPLKKDATAVAVSARRRKKLKNLADDQQMSIDLTGHQLDLGAEE